MENPCLRPACFGDIYNEEPDNDGGGMRYFPKVNELSSAINWGRTYALKALYDAEWAKRGFERSP